MAHRETRLIARNAARWIEYPTAQLALGDHDWSLPLLARPILLGAFGALVVLGLRRVRRPAQPFTAAAASTTL